MPVFTLKVPYKETLASPPWQSFLFSYTMGLFSCTIRLFSYTMGLFSQWKYHIKTHVHHCYDSHSSFHILWGSFSYIIGLFSCTMGLFSYSMRLFSHRQYHIKTHAHHSHDSHSSFQTLLGSFLNIYSSFLNVYGSFPRKTDAASWTQNNRPQNSVSSKKHVQQENRIKTQIHMTQVNIKTQINRTCSTRKPYQDTD